MIDRARPSILVMSDDSVFSLDLELSLRAGRFQPVLKSPVSREAAPGVLAPFVAAIVDFASPKPRVHELIDHLAIHELPVIAVTTSDSRPLRSNPAILACFEKPLDVEAMTGTVSALLRGRRRPKHGIVTGGADRSGCGEDHAARPR
ncbi:hypothetical protein OB2597_14776 [Pseudooceanicola batsensis HTCC2597]|uniref:Response regulatory domain-containing protein n=1 Tax=Pseudooceanicola batsensis (strain ATCC BAA-863 / DSM 15984 / KCTC 12145 / HTCC2597) TaxID=252305 RepID=A3U2B7_PSEBH|nr:hypothetical protein OB2597_14776 [Pseudooceanicola batsensis HTCC2597]